MTTAKTTANNDTDMIKDWIHGNFSIVPRIMVERAYHRKFLPNKIKTIVGDQDLRGVSRTSNELYLIQDHKIVQAIRSAKGQDGASVLASFGFQLLKTADNLYFLQPLEYDLNTFENNWVPLFNSLYRTTRKEPVRKTAGVQKKAIFDVQEEAAK